MADGDAIEGLERSRATLQEYADSRGLILSSESPWPGYVPAEQQSGPVRHAIWSLAGRFPGGAVGRLRHQAVLGKTMGIDDSVKEWDSARGLEAESPATFHSRHITLPLPGAATDAVTGTLPGAARRGSIAWISFSSDVDMERNYVAVVGELPGTELPVAWVEPGEAAVPGFGADIPSAALEDAKVGGLGIPPAGEAAAVILEAGGGPGSTIGGAEIDALIPRATKIFDALA